MVVGRALAVRVERQTVEVEGLEATDHPHDALLDALDGDELALVAPASAERNR